MLLLGGVLNLAPPTSELIDEDVGSQVDSKKNLKSSSYFKPSRLEK